MKADDDLSYSREQMEQKRTDTGEGGIKRKRTV